MKLINVSEIMARSSVDHFLRSNRNYCACDRCKMDILAIVLNNLPPKYVVTDEGEVYSRAGMFDQQHQTDILAQIVKAVSIVSRNPKH